MELTIGIVGRISGDTSTPRENLADHVTEQDETKPGMTMLISGCNCTYELVSLSDEPELGGIERQPTAHSHKGSWYSGKDNPCPIPGVSVNMFPHLDRAELGITDTVTIRGKKYGRTITKVW